MKCCRKCNQGKGDDEFYKGQSQCKTCALAYTKEWKKKNPEKRAAYRKDWKKRNPDKVRASAKISSKKQYDADPQRSKAYIRAAKLEISEWKAAQGCQVCEEREPCCLDLHHLDPNTKERTPSQIATLKVFLKEAEKCVVLCKNCHAKEHKRLRLINKENS